MALRGVAQPGSAPVWGTGGRRFKSSHPDYDINPLYDTLRRAGSFCPHHEKKTILVLSPLEGVFEVVD